MRLEEELLDFLKHLDSMDSLPCGFEGVTVAHSVLF